MVDGYVTRALTLDEVRRARLRSQGLLPGRGASTAPEAVLAGAALQAQDGGAAVLGVRVRSAGLGAEDVHRARTGERSILWTWALRGTLHFLRPEEAAWLLPLIGPENARTTVTRRAQLGFDEDSARRAVEVIRNAIASRGPLVRAEIRDLLREAGLPWEGQATAHAIYLAAALCVICRGADRGAEPEHVLLEEWADLPPPPPREEALARLARLYLAAYAPAAVEDLGAWCKLPAADVRRAWSAIEGERVEVDTVLGRLSVLRDRADVLDVAADVEPCVRLLPAFDGLLLGHRSREFLLAPEHARRILNGGIIAPAVLVDGEVLGAWKLERRRRSVSVRVEPFDATAAWSPEVRAGIEAEVADIGRYLGVEAALAE